MRRWLILALAAAAALLGACGSGSSTGSGTAAGSGGTTAMPATLVLDFTPNAIHAGIYSALARKFDRAAGVQLRVVAPSASTDSVRLLATGRVNFAILDIHDLAIARERGADIVGIMAIVERPLAALIAQPQIRDPSELGGKLVGVTGDPSDTAVLDSIVAGSGGDPSKVRTVSIGFNAVAALLSGRVAAATAFWNDEGVTLQRRRPGFHIFRVDDFGAPSYPELVLCATRATLRRQPALARAVVRALVRGYRFTVSDPAASAADLESRVTGLDSNLVHAELGAIRPAFRASDGRVGVLLPRTLSAWARWEARFHIVSRQPDVARAFDRRLVAAAAQ